MKIMEINEKEFYEKIENINNKVIIDCYASWCGPCRMLAPILEQLASEITDCDFYKIDIDESNEVAHKYNIMSIPTILIFEKGELVKQIVGLKTKEELENLIK